MLVTLQLKQLQDNYEKLSLKIAELSGSLDEAQQAKHSAELRADEAWRFSREAWEQHSTNTQEQAQLTIHLEELRKAGEALFDFASGNRVRAEWRKIVEKIFGEQAKLLEGIRVRVQDNVPLDGSPLDQAEEDRAALLQMLDMRLR